MTVPIAHSRCHSEIARARQDVRLSKLMNHSAHDYYRIMAWCWYEKFKKEGKAYVQTDLCISEIERKLHGCTGYTPSVGETTLGLNVEGEPVESSDSP